jgi:hypothetical protein
MSLSSWFCLMALLMFSSLEATEPKKMAPAEAGKHIGETATVCGKVVSTRISKYEIPGRGRPTYLNLDEPEPKPVFLIVTWPADPKKSGQPDDPYQGMQVCVTGKIIKARGVPQIIAPEPSQIKLQSAEKQ